MEKQIVEQIKKFIVDSKSDQQAKDLHKSSYVRGYQKALDDIQRIITLGEALTVKLPHRED